MHTESMEKLPLVISVERAGALLGMSRSAAYRAVAAGVIPVLRCGRRMVVPTAQLLSLVGLDGPACLAPIAVGE
jgi:excisionase family DNA binding protein